MYMYMYIYIFLTSPAWLSNGNPIFLGGSCTGSCLTIPSWYRISVPIPSYLYVFVQWKVFTIACDYIGSIGRQVLFSLFISWKVYTKDFHLADDILSYDCIRPTVLPPHCPFSSQQPNDFPIDLSEHATCWDEWEGWNWCVENCPLSSPETQSY